MPRWRHYYLLFCLLLLGACSSTTFVYNQLDLILPWYVNDYVELNTQQDSHLDELLEPFLQWHRSEELPAYIAILEGLESRVDHPMAGADVAEVFTEFESAWLRLEDTSLDWLLDLGGQLSDEQMNEFVAALWEKQEEFEEEYLERTDKEFYKDSFDNFKDNAEEYLGRLSPEQREQLQTASSQLLRSDETWLAERYDWLKKLEVLLAREPGWQQRVQEAVVAQRQNLSPEYVRIYEHNMGVIADAIAELLNGRSERQDKHLRERLAELREDLETLVAQEPGAVE